MKFVFDEDKKKLVPFETKILPMGKFKLNKSITKMSGTVSHTACRSFMPSLHR